VKIEIVERQPVKVAYLRYTGPMGPSLERFWRATVAPWLADHGLVDCPRYGVIRPSHLPSGADTTPASSCPLASRFRTPSKPRFRVAATSSRTSKAPEPGSARPGVRSFSTRQVTEGVSIRGGTASSTIPAAPVSMRAPGCSPASCACHWRTDDPRAGCHDPPRTHEQAGYLRK
jgi:hypothetical protein